MGANLINAGGLWIEIKKNFCIFFTNCWYLPEEFPPQKPTDPIKQRSNKVSRNYVRYSDSWLNVLAIKKFFIKISGHQQRWPRPLPGAILIPPAPLVVADFITPFLFREFRFRCQVSGVRKGRRNSISWTLTPETLRPKRRIKMRYKLRALIWEFSLP